MPPITSSASRRSRIALFQTGFRPFFLGASCFSVLSMSIWLIAYSTDWQIGSFQYFRSATNWHAHEMIFGYTLAVVAGFLLTAVKNWTGIQTAAGTKLCLLFSIWLVARVMVYFTDGLYSFVLPLADLLFNFYFVATIAIPLLKTDKRSNFWIIVPKLFLLALANLLFYLGQAGVVEDGMRYGLYGGVYLILSLIFVMARRVMPFFIERALGITVRNDKRIDILSLILFLLFFIIDMINPFSKISAVIAALLVVLHCIRLSGWYHPGIWSRPLLWVLFAGYLWIILGLAIKAVSAFAGWSPLLALHAYTFGGIGMMTLGMMARISLGHTGRDIYHPPGTLKWAFTLMMIGCVIRVIPPLFTASYYAEMIALSQLLWVFAFTLFLVRYLPLFIFPRIDGQPG
ncbi:MAG: NnrS family protein [Gammaproteobacteria bacterium]